MESMQFRDFIFPHNPAVITVSAARRVTEDFLPGKGEITRDLGKRPRRVTCNGCFYGATYSDAISQLTRFRSITEGNGGTLFLPGYPPFTAHLKELSFEAGGDGRIIPYTMVFVEEQAL